MNLPTKSYGKSRTPNEAFSREKINSNWLFPQSIEEMKSIQKQMAQQVIQEDTFNSPEWIGGMDVSHNVRDPAQMIYAAAIILHYPSLKQIEQSCHSEQQKFPYIPGFLGFREAPALVNAFKNLQRKPDLLMIDGHGICHPRGLGIASHLGVLLDIPTIGVAKSILVGLPAASLQPEVGSQVPLVWNGKTLGILYRSKKRAHPLVISVGHKISLPSAVTWASRCLQGYRLPEPTRQAHLAANSCRKQFHNNGKLP